MNGKVKFQVNVHGGEKLHFRAMLSSIVRLRLVVRFKLRARLGLQVKVQAKIQAKMADVQCEVRLSLLIEG